jgi:hypothetical protein
MDHIVAALFPSCTRIRLAILSRQFFGSLLEHVPIGWNHPIGRSCSRKC